MRATFRGFSTALLCFTLIGISTPVQAEDDPAAALTRERMGRVVSAIKTYKKLTKRYPSGLNLLLTGTITPIKLSALIKDENELKDGWDKLFVYQTNNDNESFRLISYGADGARGGADLNADIIEKSPGFNPRPEQFDY